jgi:soluble lytic murein transglycosylase-like protein
VRRFRDAKGVLHIVGQGSAPDDHFPAPPDRMITQTGLTPVALGPSYPTLPRPSLPAWPEPTVSLRRDKQGRLVIQNAPRRGATKGDKEDVRSQLAPVLLEAAYLFALPVSLVEAVIKVESNFQPAALSPKGAMGLMQLMPGTAKFLGVTDAFCPRENILGGTRYLRLLLDFFGQSLPLALAAYNAGFQRVIDAGWRVPEIKETQDFVAKVMGHYYLREKQYAAQRLLL